MTLSDDGTIRVVFTLRDAQGGEAGIEARSFRVGPDGVFFVSEDLPGFQFKAVITAPDGTVISTQQDPACISETICVSGAIPGRSEAFIRVVGPRPNGYMWPTLVKFTTSQVEVWIEQPSSGQLNYYLLEGASPGSDDLSGLFDRQGFLP